ncbi:transferrin-binding protein-like solute binding protein [Chelativorans salis]|uniref:Transferrin-binding protein-like solute binding protein n=1 Tax=Chelativorans salis TaxID=2978478 RepID=A0ABT2LR33_9HYPH|nr:transferrin-binding protein-like solute binding protein [Chelativorans sp. EGI FJ00035]MCT7375813.1 transferrin-binding protein-like solute binding protein [Chelativorans sp. EGI FJ00035]
MKTKKIILAGAMGVAGIGLAGCGGGGSTSAIVDALYAEDVGTTAEALDTGKTLKAYNGNMSKGVRMQDGVWSDVTAPNLTIKKNDEGGVDVSVDGIEVSYSASDLSDDGYGWQQGDFGLYTRSADSAEDALAGKAAYDHHQVWSYFWSTGEGALNGLAVIGTETKASALTSEATATYSGYAHADLYTKGSDSFDRERVRGALDMTARFDEGKISGSISSLQDRVTDDTIAGSVSMNETDIDGNAFSGSLTPDAALAGVVGDFEGNYAGKFYGPGGEEVGGVLSFGSDAEDGELIGAGMFSAGKDD